MSHVGNSQGTPRKTTARVIPTSKLHLRNLHPRKEIGTSSPELHPDESGRWRKTPAIFTRNWSISTPFFAKSPNKTSSPPCTGPTLPTSAYTTPLQKRNSKQYIQDFHLGLATPPLQAKEPCILDLRSTTASSLRRSRFKTPKVSNHASIYSQTKLPDRAHAARSSWPANLLTALIQIAAVCFNPNDLWFELAKVFWHRIMDKALYHPNPGMFRAVSLRRNNVSTKRGKRAELLYHARQKPLEPWPIAAKKNHSLPNHRQKHPANPNLPNLGQKHWESLPKPSWPSTKHPETPIYKPRSKARRHGWRWFRASSCNVTPITPPMPAGSFLAPSRRRVAFHTALRVRITQGAGEAYELWSFFSPMELPSSRWKSA